MVLTVTLNLALDVTYALERVEWHAANRVASVASRGGGKGVNVARVLSALGHEVMVSGLAGGATGDAVARDLDLVGIACALEPIAGESRRTLAVIDGARGDATGFWEPGPSVTPAEWERFRARFAVLLRDATVVVLSGSLPRGLPADAYAMLCGAAREAGVPALLDADGDALRLGLAGAPAIVKPNAAELTRAAPAGNAAELTRAAPAGNAAGAADDAASAAGARGDAAAGHAAGAADAAPRDDDDDDAVVAAAQSLRAAGAEAVVVSRGAEGLVAVTPGGAWRARPPEPVAGNPTGAGDAVVAALAAGVVAGSEWPERLRDAVALSAAAVHAPLAGDFDATAYRRYREAARAEPLR